MQEASAVKVIVRIRPLLPTDQADGSRDCLQLSPMEPSLRICSYLPGTTTIAHSHTFTFDHVIPHTMPQLAVYEPAVSDLVMGALEGFNATVLAYGQTGSGKTHTMGSAAGDNSVLEELGVIPRALQQVFQGLQDKGAAVESVVTASFIEIYNEHVRDLLCPNALSSLGADATPLTIRQNSDGSTCLNGVTETPVTDFEGCCRCLQSGSQSRATHATAMNAQSSRSHAIFFVTLRQQDIATGRCLTSKLHFVDLAGSERAKRSKAEGERLKEGISINKGLLALGNVISVLGDAAKRGGHVPYRDSQITRLLQDSLGGNSNTLMIACVSPAEADSEETLNTLKYANRARNIQNKITKNEGSTGAQIVKEAARIAAEIKAAEEEQASNIADRKSVV